MIIDTLDNLHRYTCLSPGIQQVVDYLSSHPLESLPDGRHEVSGDDVWVNVQTCAPRSLEEAPVEAHRLMMDIQIPLDAHEVHGFRPLTEAELQAAAYDPRADISFFTLTPQLILVSPLASLPCICPVRGMLLQSQTARSGRRCSKSNIKYPYNHVHY